MWNKLFEQLEGTDYYIIRGNTNESSNFRQMFLEKGRTRSLVIVNDGDIKDFDSQKSIESH